MNLDTSERYFRTTENTLIMQLPKNCTSHVINEAQTHLKGKIANAIDAGIGQMIFDLNEVTRLDMAAIKLLISAMQACREVTLRFAILGSESLAEECQGYEDTHGWQFHETMEAAEQALSGAPGELVGSAGS